MASSQSVPPEKRAERNLECESPPGPPACPPGRVSTGVDLVSTGDGARVDLASTGVDLVSPRDGVGVDLASTRDATTFFSPPPSESPPPPQPMTCETPLPCCAINDITC